MNNKFYHRETKSYTVKEKTRLEDLILKCIVSFFFESYE